MIDISHSFNVTKDMNNIERMYGKNARQNALMPSTTGYPGNESTTINHCVYNVTNWTWIDVGSSSKYEHISE